MSSVEKRSEPGLVPELLVTDLGRSLHFWRDLCGFGIHYERPDEGFAYLIRGDAHIMLEQHGIGRNWISGPLETPYGRGVNFQIDVASASPILADLRGAGYPLFMEPEVKWYRIAEDEEVGVEQFLVADPDGYLVRFQARLGSRSAG